MLTTIVSTLPAKWQPYAKAYAAALLSALTTIAALTPVPQWVVVVIALLSAPVVYATPNLDPRAEKQAESVQPPAAAVGDELDEFGSARAGIESIAREALNRETGRGL